MKNFNRISELPKYVFNIIDDMKAKAKEDGQQIIDFGMGNPDLPPASHIMDCFHEALAMDNFHRYSESKGILELRQAICVWYQKRFAVDLCPDTETVATIGSKEGLSHLAMAMTNEDDTILIPGPSYPIHNYGFVLAGAKVERYSILDGDVLENIENAIKDSWPKPKAIVLNFPANPTTTVVNLDFYQDLVKLAKDLGIWLIQDFAYADIVFDDYEAPSILQVSGAKDIAVETFTLSKSYNLPGMRIGFVSGNKTLVAALTRIKTYMDYGVFRPIQQAATEALLGPQDCVEETRLRYQQRRDAMCDMLNSIGWTVEKPKATMFVWAKIPKMYLELKSLEFCKYLLENTGIAVSPGIGFGELGDDYVRFSLIEDQTVIDKAGERLAELFKRDQQGVA